MISEFMEVTGLQICPPNGNGFWHEQPAFSKIDDWNVLRVRWNGRDWACKEQERTLNEIVAYQIAAAIGLPVQPWLAFVSPRRESNRAGILVEWWNSSHLWAPIEWANTESGVVVARALALWTFNGDELPHWCLSEDKTERRLMDLEGIGPWPKCLRKYRAETEAAYRNRRMAAGDLVSAFDAEVLRLLNFEFSSVIDLSGHPDAHALTKTILAALTDRQRKLRKLLVRG